MEKEGIKTRLKVEGVDDAIEKLNRYVELLKEANSLAQELASTELEMNVICGEKPEDYGSCTGC